MHVLVHVHVDDPSLAELRRRPLVHRRLYLLPNPRTLRFYESGSPLALAHEWAISTCVHAQEEICRASMDELDQLPAAHPR